MGHAALQPCVSCSYQRRDGRPRHKDSVTSADLSMARCQRRYDAIRRSGYSSIEFRSKFGLTNGGHVEIEQAIEDEETLPPLRGIVKA
jgi:hypothetical protein